MFTKVRQDLPPEGGYQKIVYDRVPPKVFFSSWRIFLGVIALSVYGHWSYSKQYKINKRRKIENISGWFAVLPVILAEKDRAYLKQLKKNVEAEEKLMADVPGWEVGTYYGARVYKSVSEDYFVDPIFDDYYIHASPRDRDDRAFIRHSH